MFISRSIMAHECSSSTRVVVVLSIVSKRFKAIWAWSDKPGSILHCLTMGTVIEEQKNLKESSKFLCCINLIL
jgi:hypothetical protein